MVLETVTVVLIDDIVLGQWYFCDIQVGRTGGCLL
jgi:hypothetical protein